MLSGFHLRLRFATVRQLTLGNLRHSRRGILLASLACLLLVPCAAQARKLHVGQRCTQRLEQLYIRSKLNCVQKHLRRASLAALREGEPLLLDKHGRIDPRNALEAFSARVGHLPGIKVRHGAVGRFEDATDVVVAVAAQRHRLSRAQRGVLDRVLKPKQPLTASGFTNSERNQVETLALQARNRIVNHGFAVNHRLVLSYDTTEPGGEVGFVDPGWLVGVPGYADACVIHVNPTFFNGGLAFERKRIAAFVFYCAEGEFFHSPASLDNAPEWVTNGGKEWLAATVAQEWNTAVGIRDLFWPLWVNRPELDLAKRQYDALGFFALLDQSGIDAFARLHDTLEAAATGGDHSAYAAAIGGVPSAFFDTWGPGFARNRNLGPNWDLTGPGLTATPGLREPEHYLIDWQHEYGFFVDPRGAEVASLDLEADVVSVQSTASHGRLRTADGVEVPLRTEVLCTEPGGCKCDKGRLSARQVRRGDAWLGWQGGGVSVTGTTIENECKRQQRENPPPTAPPGADACHVLALSGVRPLFRAQFYAFEKNVCFYGACFEHYKEGDETKCAYGRNATLSLQQLGSPKSARDAVKQKAPSPKFHSVAVGGADIARLRMTSEGGMLVMATGRNTAIYLLGAASDRCPHGRNSSPCQYSVWHNKPDVLRTGSRIAQHL